MCQPRSAADWQRQVENALLSKHAAAEESRQQRLERQALVAAAEAARRSGRPPLAVPVLTQADRWDWEGRDGVHLKGGMHLQWHWSGF